MKYTKLFVTALANLSVLFGASSLFAQSASASEAKNISCPDFSGIYELRESSCQPALAFRNMPLPESLNFSSVTPLFTGNTYELTQTGCQSISGTRLSEGTTLPDVGVFVMQSDSFEDQEFDDSGNPILEMTAKLQITSTATELKGIETNQVKMLQPFFGLLNSRSVIEWQMSLTPQGDIAYHMSFVEYATPLGSLIEIELESDEQTCTLFKSSAS